MFVASFLSMDNKTYDQAEDSQSKKERGPPSDSSWRKNDLNEGTRSKGFYHPTTYLPKSTIPPVTDLTLDKWTEKGKPSESFPRFFGSAFEIPIFWNLFLEFGIWLKKNSLLFFLNSTIVKIQIIVKNWEEIGLIFKNKKQKAK